MMILDLDSQESKWPLSIALLSPLAFTEFKKKQAITQLFDIIRYYWSFTYL
jgi:hypothetical protein